jgi:spore maturation protein CgeB
MIDFQGMPSTSMIECDFTVISEDYSKYLLQDGTILKVKIVVKKIFRSADVTPEGFPAGLSFDSVNAVAAIVPPAMKGPPSKELWDPRKDVGKEIKFDPLEEKWQEYVTNDGFKIMVKPVVVKVLKYDKRNIYGEPIYAATIQAITNVEKFTSTAT